MSKKRKSAAGGRTVRPLVGRRVRIDMDVSGLPAAWQVWFWYKIHSVWRGLVKVNFVNAPNGEKPKHRKPFWIPFQRIRAIETYHASHEVM